jgi:xanthine/CO dehydrogenase XdhC/CoxF family maturation factor
LAEHSNAVVMTHNYRRDLSLLEVLLPSPVRYASPAQLRRLHAPAGLDPGAEGPEEIALAILAEVKATVAHRAAGRLREHRGPIDDGDVSRSHQGRES